jgi:hypothetical protein
MGAQARMVVPALKLVISVPAGGGRRWIIREEFNRLVVRQEVLDVD